MKPLLDKPLSLIFDMDGTLLDTEPLYTVASQKILDPFGVEFTLALKKQCMGGDAKRSAQIVIDHYDLPLSAEAFLADREAILRELFINAAEIGGAGNFIQSLTKTSLPIGLATSSHKELVDLKLSSKSWSKGFNTIVCGDDPELERGKPAPDIFLLCAKRLGLEPSMCIAFEDSPTGVKAAKAAGMQVIAVNSPYVDEGDLKDASLIIDHYDELADLFRIWTG
ncbi:MAG: pseudouridine-5'-monophosphatase [Candidatus Azotimanducaceae bacterium]|jgi:pseudouridine-5'-monophosphatase